MRARAHGRRRPHLLEVGLRWPPETFLEWKLEGLARRGFRVTVASKAIDDPSRSLAGVELLPVPPRRLTGMAAARVIARHGTALALRSPARLVRLVRAMRRDPLPSRHRARYGGTPGLLALYLPLARTRPDLVHFEWPTVAADYLPLLAVWRRPVTIACHGSEVSIYPHVEGYEHYTARLPALLERVDAAHCVSHSLAREVAALGLDPARARVIAQGVDPDRFHPAAPRPSRPPGPLRVVSVGWLRWVKGLEYGVQAIADAAARGVPVELDVLGGAPAGVGDREPQRVVHAVEDLGLAERVRLRGAVDSATVARALRDADVLLHPSVSEGLPTAVLEAMASGIPVVATDCGGVGEAVTDGAEGFVVAPRDAGAMADALERLWREPELRSRMGAAARRRAVSHFALDRHLDEVEAFFRDALDRVADAGAVVAAGPPPAAAVEELASVEAVPR